MARSVGPRENHFINRIGWLRAAVLGANDGVLSTGSLIIGVAASSASRSSLLVTGLAGLVAGAMSMAAGEYVSVSSQSDTERADLEKEATELSQDPKGELKELAAIYVRRGLEPQLAREVAGQLMAKDALKAHARDELGISAASQAHPIQAAMSSAASFASGAALPLAATLFSPSKLMIPAVGLASLIALSALGAMGAKAGGASVPKGMIRVIFWGVCAMIVTAAAGMLFGGKS